MIAQTTPRSPLTQEEVNRLEGIFNPVARSQREALYKPDSPPWAKFVHYTSAEAALKIIESKRLWMRNTTCMADYREVQHGYDILWRFFHDETKKKAFMDAFDSCAQGVASEAIDLFDKWWANVY